MPLEIAMCISSRTISDNALNLRTDFVRLMAEIRSENVKKKKELTHFL